MKTIGLIGGMTWHSTVTYYRIINKVVSQKLGGMHSAQIVLRSLDFYEIEQRQIAGKWDENAEILTKVAQEVEKAGADFLLICANTMHKVADAVQAGISIPIVHIADITADALLEAGITKTALLGTRFTMQEDFYTTRLQNRGIEVLVPTAPQMQRIDSIIFEELGVGVIKPESKAFYLSVIDDLAGQGAQGAILGCTEIGLLVQQADTETPLFDTAVLHPTKAALLALEE